MAVTLKDYLESCKMTKWRFQEIIEKDREFFNSHIDWGGTDQSGEDAKIELSPAVRARINELMDEEDSKKAGKEVKKQEEKPAPQPKKAVKPKETPKETPKEAPKETKPAVKAAKKETAKAAPKKDTKSKPEKKSEYAIQPSDLDALVQQGDCSATALRKFLLQFLSAADERDVNALTKIATMDDNAIREQFNSEYAVLKLGEKTVAIRKEALEKLLGDIFILPTND